MDYESKIIDHLGIVAGVCDEIGLVEEIDKIVGVNDKQKVTTGEAVMAMVINGLWFCKSTTLSFFEIYANQACESPLS